MRKRTLTIDLDKLRADVEAHGAARLKAQGKGNFDEVDFFCGAAAMYDALGIWENVPPMWILGPMSGRSVLEERKER